MAANQTEMQDLLGLMENLLNIGIALSSQKDNNRLLEMILTEARRITNADAGTLYLCQQDRLIFKIMQNRTMDIYRGGGGEVIDIPPVDLVKENVSAYVALTRKSVNIADVYHAGGFDFSGPRQYDRITGYRTQSMLVVPMENHESEIIGVLQLINAMDDDNRTVIPFAPQHQKVIESLASQAAISITNVKLVSDIEQLFHSFVRTITTAIDARTPYNANHSRRVALLSGKLAEAINKSDRERWHGQRFDKERLDQLVMAGWLHDIGKVATPLEVMNKATRLESRMDLVLQRFDYARQAVTADFYRKKLLLAEKGELSGIAELEAEYQKMLESIAGARELVVKCNNPATLVDQALADQLAAAARITCPDINGRPMPLLTAEELEALCVDRGTLTDSERRVMEEHVIITARMLEKIPFIKKYAMVPVFSAMHHEYLDGMGYPSGLAGAQIPLEARILALVDVFDALTASDRPYKKAMPVETALRVLESMVGEGKLDGDLLELFKEHRVWEGIEARD